MALINIEKGMQNSVEALQKNFTMLQTEIDELKGNVVDLKSAQTIEGVKTFDTIPQYKDSGRFLPTVDTGWLQDGLKFGSNIDSVQELRYRVLSVGTFQALSFAIHFKIKQALLSGKWGSDDTAIFYLPNQLKVPGYIPQRFLATKVDVFQPSLVLRTMNTTDNGLLFFEGFIDASTEATQYSDGSEFFASGTIQLSDRGL